MSETPETNKKSGCRFILYAALIVILLPVIYVFSVAPANWLYWRIRFAGADAEDTFPMMIRECYEPLFDVAWYCEKYGWYVYDDFYSYAKSLENTGVELEPFGLYEE